MSNIIVSGAFGVLGSAIVATLLERGHRVAAVDMAAAPALPANVLAFPGVDGADEAAVEAAYIDAAARLGRIDGLINSAGGFTWQPVASGSADEWDRMYRMNLRTAAVSSRAVLRHMTGDGGSIVNVGASAASAPGVGMAPYAASKAGVMALTQSLAEELRERRIRVNAVLPTILDTPSNRADMPDAERSEWVNPADAAKVIAFLLSADAAAISGAAIRLSVGRTT